MESPAQIPATLAAPGQPPTTVMVAVDERGLVPAVLVDPQDRMGRVVTGTWVNVKDGQGGRPLYRLMTPREDA